MGQVRDPWSSDLHQQSARVPSRHGIQADGVSHAGLSADEAVNHALADRTESQSNGSITMNDLNQALSAEEVCGAASRPVPPLGQGRRDVGNAARCGRWVCRLQRRLDRGGSSESRVAGVEAFLPEVISATGSRRMSTAQQCGGAVGAGIAIGTFIAKLTPV